MTQPSPWATLDLTNVGGPIDLDSRIVGQTDPHVVVRGTLVGVAHYLDRDSGQKRTRLEVRTFGEHVSVLEFIDGDLTRPAPLDDDDEPGIPTIH